MVAIRCLSKALDHSRRKPSEASLGSAFRKRSIWQFRIAFQMRYDNNERRNRSSQLYPYFL